MKASPWEKEDAAHEDIPIIDNHVPKSFVIENGKLKGMTFDKVKAVYDDKGKRQLVSSGEPEVFIEADDVLVAVGQENSFPWIEKDLGLEFDKWNMPVVDEVTFASTHKKVFFGGDAAFGPKNVITAVAHGHQAAISIDLMCRGESMDVRPSPFVNLVSQKMGIHEWAYDSMVETDKRYAVPQADKKVTLTNRKKEVELGFDHACVDICPTTCITFTENADESDLRTMLKMPATNTSQDLYVSSELKTKRVMVKDENVCLHCGLCAERCPTSAWDMQKFFYNVTKAHTGCASHK
jgi:ferredoxin